MGKLERVEMERESSPMPRSVDNHGSKSRPVDCKGKLGWISYRGREIQWIQFIILIHIKHECFLVYVLLLFFSVTWTILQIESFLNRQNRLMKFLNYIW